jgi:hypothetical protein
VLVVQPGHPCFFSSRVRGKKHQMESFVSFPRRARFHFFLFLGLSEVLVEAVPASEEGGILAVHPLHLFDDHRETLVIG